MVVVPIGYGSLNAALSLYARLSLRLPIMVAVCEFDVAVPGLTVAGSHPDGELAVTFAGQVIVKT